MAGAASVMEDDSLISRLDRRLSVLEKFFALISGIAVFGLMVLAVVSVTGRQFFNRPLPGYVDWIELSMPIIAFLGVSYVQRLGGHVRMDIVVGQLKGRALWLAELVTTICVLILIVLLIWGSWAHFDRSFDFGAPNWSRDSTIDIGLPIWPAKLIVPVAFTVLALRLCLQIWGFGRAFIRNDDQPPAVPLILSAAEIAQMEAEILEEKSR
ncbi:Tripartite ATP-independent periplasmic transporters, DctQ component [Rhodobacteraceae bacterium THAF1]|uniref:TRAP transporter small permease subunit n=1 Tax=Palleronia sp. THAF1 TaxID=2587842 RepID=UPI000F40FEDE|nr:TRAP transporter small permease [Palleronia sp. THAF1]QFU08608.1 Tripartite ATP-independent periplasmic transporter, DctQ component [Palleronia sp. THAF1]VDC30713.1 Tripartite ATP-independent periplasmic transporters, DctQ component [Rhodobacteraceae bacterium THAF1]